MWKGWWQHVVTNLAPFLPFRMGLRQIEQVHGEEAEVEALPGVDDGRPFGEAAVELAREPPREPPPMLAKMLRRAPAGVAVPLWCPRPFCGVVCVAPGVPSGDGMGLATADCVLLGVKRGDARDYALAADLVARLARATKRPVAVALDAAPVGSEPSLASQR